MFFVLCFFLIHWFLSLFFHSFFLHRYASHQMYTTTKRWEKLFYFMTFLTQGSSYLVPGAYAVMHRMHHKYSDTDKDPHSPHFFRDIWQMMWHTYKLFGEFHSGNKLPDPQFTKEYIPRWDRLDKIGNHIITRILFALSYTAFYIIFAPNLWWFLLLPVHFFMGPVQGAIVNWFGHKLGYANYSNGDHSKNTTPWGFIMMGELFQNNHHYKKYDPNFARRWYEIDGTFIIMTGLQYYGIIKLKPLTA
jgi:stearoyl-CoA desaturase (Delta-9 desaturase)